MHRLCLHKAGKGAIAGRGSLIVFLGQLKMNIYLLQLVLISC
jgi:hypothetical protein